MKRKANFAKERAKVKAQKEEQERIARSQALPSLNALDIPAELASIFNKIDGEADESKNYRFIFFLICVMFVIQYPVKFSELVFIILASKSIVMPVQN